MIGILLAVLRGLCNYGASNATDGIDTETVLVVAEPWCNVQALDNLSVRQIIQLRQLAWKDKYIVG